MSNNKGGEISLKPYQFCNLVECNVDDVTTQEELELRVTGAATIATLQAGYTDFSYLRDVWRTTTEEDALIGVGLTGIASGRSLGLNYSRAATVAVETNKIVSELIGINPAKRVTTIKPSGTSSLILGTSSGIHAWFAPYYKRRVRYGINEPITGFLLDTIPRFMEMDQSSPGTAILTLPMKAPDSAILRDEGALATLERIKKFYSEWIIPGHIEGENTNNISATVNVRDDEWDLITDWMWRNREYYHGISLLPYDGGSYTQAPLEEITSDEYFDLYDKLGDFDISQFKESEDNTNLVGELACSGGSCEVR